MQSVGGPGERTYHQRGEEEEQGGVEQGTESLDVERENLEREAAIGKPEGTTVATHQRPQHGGEQEGKRKNGKQRQLRCPRRVRGPIEEALVDERKEIEPGESHDDRIGKERCRTRNTPVDGRACRGSEEGCERAHCGHDPVRVMIEQKEAKRDKPNNEADGG